MFKYEMTVVEADFFYQIPLFLMSVLAFFASQSFTNLV